MSSDILTEAVSASISGIVSSTTLFPLEIIKTRMQAMDKAKPPADSSSTVPVQELKEKTPPRRGGKKADESPETTTEGSSSSSDSEQQHQQHQQHQQQQLEPSEPKSNTMESVASEIYAADGLAGFMKGCHFSAVQSALEKGVYFLGYTFLKNSYCSVTESAEIGTLTNLGLGCLAEWCHLPLSLPLDVLTTKLATDKTNASAFVIMSNLMSEKGIAGMYKGYQAFFVLCLKPSIQYTIFEKLKGLVVASKVGNDKSLTAAEAFLLGMVARTVATIAVFPYVRAKVMLQAGGGQSANLTIPQMLRAVYEDEGLAGLFKGIGPELTRGVLSAALMLTVKEKIAGTVGQLLKGKRRAYA